MRRITQIIVYLLTMTLSVEPGHAAVNQAGKNARELLSPQSRLDNMPLRHAFNSSKSPSLTHDTAANINNLPVDQRAKFSVLQEQLLKENPDHGEELSRLLFNFFFTRDPIESIEDFYALAFAEHYRTNPQLAQIVASHLPSDDRANFWRDFLQKSLPHMRALKNPEIVLDRRRLFELFKGISDIKNFNFWAYERNATAFLIARSLSWYQDSRTEEEKLAILQMIEPAFSFDISLFSSSPALLTPTMPASADDLFAALMHTAAAMAREKSNLRDPYHINIQEALREYCDIKRKMKLLAQYQPQIPSPGETSYGTQIDECLRRQLSGLEIIWRSVESSLINEYSRKIFEPIMNGVQIIMPLAQDETSRQTLRRIQQTLYNFTEEYSALSGQDMRMMVASISAALNDATQQLSTEATITLLQAADIVRQLSDIVDVETLQSLLPHYAHVLRGTSLSDDRLKDRFSQAFVACASAQPRGNRLRQILPSLDEIKNAETLKYIIASIEQLLKKVSGHEKTDLLVELIELRDRIKPAVSYTESDNLIQRLSDQIVWPAALADLKLLESIRDAAVSRDSFAKYFASQSGCDIFLEHLDLILSVFNPTLSPYRNTIEKAFRTPGIDLSSLIPLYIDGRINDFYEQTHPVGTHLRLLTRHLFQIDTYTSLSAGQNAQETQQMLKKILRTIPPGILAAGFGINIKLAAYLKSRSDPQITAMLLGNPLQRQNKEILNHIAFNLNRERTLHPAERRIGEDEKTGLFDYLLENIDQLKSFREMFDRYFRNNPQQYIIPISELKELVRVLTIDDLQKIIRSVLENPKESLESMEEAIYKAVADHPKAESISRRLQWILSNLFVLQDRLELIGPVAAAVSVDGKDITELMAALTAIDGTHTFKQLWTAADKYRLPLLATLKLKLSSIDIERQETLIAQGLQSIDNLPPTQQAELAEELRLQFDAQAQSGKLRIYLKLFFNVFPEGRAQLQQIMSSGTLHAPKSLSHRFLNDYADILHANMTMLRIWPTMSAAEASAQRSMLESLKSVSERKFYSHAGGTDAFDADLHELQSHLALSANTPQIPHFLFAPLLRLQTNEDALSIIRTMMMAFADIRDDETMRLLHNQLASRKNRLFDRIIAFGELPTERRSQIFNNIVSLVAKNYGEINKQNVMNFYDELLLRLEDYHSIITAYGAAYANLFSNRTLNQQVFSLGDDILNNITRENRIHEEKISQIKDILRLLDADLLVAQFKKQLPLENSELILEQLKQYADQNPRFKWVDYEDRTIFKLIARYLNTHAGQEEVSQTIFAALMAEIAGNFPDWKYDSPDMTTTLKEIIEIESENLGQEDRARFIAAMAADPGKNAWEKLSRISGFDAIRERVRAIKEGFEKNLTQPMEAREGTMTFTDDFYTLFNIGNYRGSTACQSCTYGNTLNAGLTGYVGNGTLKAMVYFDDSGNIITRRIVKLRIIHNEQGRREPVLFVEESDQFGTVGITELYKFLAKVSAATGLRVAKLTPDTDNNRKRILSFKEIQKETVDIEEYRGHTGFGYSDSYGEKHPQRIGAGLYRQTDPVVIIHSIAIDLIPVPSSETSQRQKPLVDAENISIPQRSLLIEQSI